MNISSLKLFQLISNLSENEEKEFKKFVASPVYTSGRNYLPILNEFVKLKKSGSINLSSHKLYEKLYPGKKYNAQTLKNRFSELYKLGEEFLIYRHFQEDNFERDKILINTFLKRNMNNFFESKFNKTFDLLSAQKVNDDKFSNVFSLKRILGNYLNKEQKMDKFYTNLYETSIYSVCLTLISLFEYGMEFKQMEYLNRKYEVNPVIGILKSIDYDNLISKISNKDFPVLDIVKFNYFLFKAFENLEDEKYYFDSREIFGKIKNSLSDEYMLRCYMTFIYYCARRQNAGIKKFHYELFKLYNEKLNHGFCSDFSERIFPVNSFRDYVFIGIEIGQHEWVENFIKNYSHLLPEEYRENEINLSYARLNISRNKFSKAYEYLIKIKPTNYLHYTDTSIMKLLCQYELDLVEEAYFEIDKVKHYLKNHPEIPKIHKTYNTNFIKVYNILLKNISKPDPMIYDYLNNLMKQLNVVSKRDWLNDKINALNGNKKKAAFKQPLFKHKSYSVL